jgi:hypothetical protein
LKLSKLERKTEPRQQPYLTLGTFCDAVRKESLLWFFLMSRDST